MTDIARLFHGITFERDFMQCRGNSFQDLFSSIMEKRYPGDFVRVKPWGKLGDRKNDGYLSSTKTVFQCFAPNKLTAKEAVEKIEEDFAGAKEHWPDMKRWVFVHNAWDGLSAPVLTKLLDLQKANPTISIGPVGMSEMLTEVRQLGRADRDALFGAAPTQDTFVALGFDDIRPIVEEIERQPPVDDTEVVPVPPDKVAHNRLSDEVEQLLRVGKGRYGLVGQYFAMHPDPNRGDQIGRALTTEYRKLRGQGLAPDVIFIGLQSFAVGSQRGTPQREAAGLAVLAYFFEQCDIFERPPAAA